MSTTRRGFLQTALAAMGLSAVIPRLQTMPAPVFPEIKPETLVPLEWDDEFDEYGEEVCERKPLAPYVPDIPEFTCSCPMISKVVYNGATGCINARVYFKEHAAACCRSWIRLL